jgi:hypothetical protein
MSLYDSYKEIRNSDDFDWENIDTSQLDAGKWTVLENSEGGISVFTFKDKDTVEEWLRRIHTEGSLQDRTEFKIFYQNIEYHYEILVKVK